MSAFLLLPSELDESDIDWLNRKLEERLRAHLAAKYLYGAVMSADAKLDTAAAGRGATADEGSPLSTKPSLLLADPTCQDCDPGYPCATHARRCEGCFAADELHDGAVSASKHGPGVTALVERWCAACDPLVPVGERYADG